MRSVLAGLFAAIFLCAAPAKADTTYTYTGNAFNALPAPPDNLPCPPACNLSGWITLSSPLASNLAFQSISPESFSFTDGQTTIDSSNVNLLNNYEIYVGTDNVGNIDTWGIELNAPIPTGSATFLFSYNYDGYTSQCVGNCVQDGAIQYNTGPNNFAYTLNDPGTWTIDTPEPSTFLLLLTGLLGLAGLIRRGQFIRI